MQLNIYSGSNSLSKSSNSARNNDLYKDDIAGFDTLSKGNQFINKDDKGQRTRAFKENYDFNKDGSNNLYEYLVSKHAELRIRSLDKYLASLTEDEVKQVISSADPLKQAKYVAALRIYTGGYYMEPERIDKEWINSLIENPTFNNKFLEDTAQFDPKDISDALPEMAYDDIKSLDLTKIITLLKVFGTFADDLVYYEPTVLNKGSVLFAKISDEGFIKTVAGCDKGSLLHVLIKLTNDQLNNIDMKKVAIIIKVFGERAINVMKLNPGILVKGSVLFAKINNAAFIKEIADCDKEALYNIFMSFSEEQIADMDVMKISFLVKLFNSKNSIWNLDNPAADLIINKPNILTDNSTLFSKLKSGPFVKSIEKCDKRSICDVILSLTDKQIQNIDLKNIIIIADVFGKHALDMVKARPEILEEGSILFKSISDPNFIKASQSCDKKALYEVISGSSGQQLNDMSMVEIADRIGSLSKIFGDKVSGIIKAKPGVLMRSSVLYEKLSNKDFLNMLHKIDREVLTYLITVMSDEQVKGMDPIKTAETIIILKNTFGKSTLDLVKAKPSIMDSGSSLYCRLFNKDCMDLISKCDKEAVVLVISQATTEERKLNIYGILTKISVLTQIFGGKTHLFIQSFPDIISDGSKLFRKLNDKAFMQAMRGCHPSGLLQSMLVIHTENIESVDLVRVAEVTRLLEGRLEYYAGSAAILIKEKPEILDKGSKLFERLQDGALQKALLMNDRRGFAIALSLMSDQQIKGADLIELAEKVEVLHRSFDLQTGQIIKSYPNIMDKGSELYKKLSDEGYLKLVDGCDSFILSNILTTLFLSEGLDANEVDLRSIATIIKDHPKDASDALSIIQYYPGISLEDAAQLTKKVPNVILYILKARSENVENIMNNEILNNPRSYMSIKDIRFNVKVATIADVKSYIGIIRMIDKFAYSFEQGGQAERDLYVQNADFIYYDLIDAVQNTKNKDLITQTYDLLEKVVSSSQAREDEREKLVGNIGGTKKIKSIFVDLIRSKLEKYMQNMDDIDEIRSEGDIGTMLENLENIIALNILPQEEKDRLIGFVFSKIGMGVSYLIFNLKHDRNEALEIKITAAKQTLTIKEWYEKYGKTIEGTADNSGVRAKKLVNYIVGGNWNYIINKALNATVLKYEPGKYSVSIYKGMNIQGCSVSQVAKGFELYGIKNNGFNVGFFVVGDINRGARLAIDAQLIAVKNRVNLAEKFRNSYKNRVFHAPLAFSEGASATTTVITKGSMHNEFAFGNTYNGIVISDRNDRATIINKQGFYLKDIFFGSDDIERYKNILPQYAERLEQLKVQKMNIGKRSDYEIFSEIIKREGYSLMVSFLTVENGEPTPLRDSGADHRRYMLLFENGEIGVVDFQVPMSVSDAASITSGIKIERNGKKYGVKYALYCDTGMYDSATLTADGKEIIVGHADEAISSNRFLLYSIEK